jgi:hypothetical protein
LSYSSPLSFTTGKAITPISPTFTGTVSSFNVSPALPHGLSLNPSSGVIAGTPSAATPQATYSVTAANASGFATFGLVITVSNPPVPAIAPEVSLIVTTKELRFAWHDVADATFYLLEHTDDGIAFDAVDQEIMPGTQAASVDIPVHTFAWSDAQFRVSACNISGCARSVLIATTGHSREAIGYLKASNTEAGDGFGFAVAISKDGHTAAVGAPYEDSGATTINGHLTNDGAGDSGPCTYSPARMPVGRSRRISKPRAPNISVGSAVRSASVAMAIR